MANFRLLCDLKQILTKYTNCDFNTWKLIGHEKFGKLLLSWEVTNEEVKPNIYTCIGLFDNDSKILEVLYSFESQINVVQASVNASKSVILYVIKEEYVHQDDKYPYIYTFHAVSILPSKCISSNIAITSHHQIMTQFLYRKKAGTDRFLTFVHQESIVLHEVTTESCEDKIEKISLIEIDSVVKVFSWAQWDVEHQCLYYIYYRNMTKTEETDELKEESKSPTLSSLQFNDDFPHETVLNIPLNLPSTLDSPFNTYEDEPVPLRVHDSSLDVIVLSDSRGLVCICHHYLYQPVKTPFIKQGSGEYTTVHLAYSVTLLHHGIVVHCMIPGIPWAEASSLRPTFGINKDDYMFVYLPGLFMHLLDLGVGHQPCCHIILPHGAESKEHWTTIKTSHAFLSLLNTQTLQIFTLDISSQELLEAFYNPNIGLYNKLSIIHYFLVHLQDFDMICQLLNTIAECSLNPSLQNIFHEILVSGTYASVMKSLNSEATKLLRFLPLTTIIHLGTIEIKNHSQTMTLTQEALWNPSVMLLTPQQRLSQFRVDLWTQLWNLIAESSCISRFKPSTVAEKLMVSLVCYQPEALSRCSTPLSPGTGFSVNSSLIECANIGNYKVKHLLPFCEIEKCTASKQEHVISVILSLHYPEWDDFVFSCLKKYLKNKWKSSISVYLYAQASCKIGLTNLNEALHLFMNLRELSIHLVKHGLENPLQVHVVATRYAAAQLEMSRFLCSLITKSCAIPVHQLKGFQLIDELPLVKKRVYFSILERYSSAIDVLAYPTPQGFSSFFSYLAYKTLQFNTFVQYAQAKAFTLQIDVMKVILSDLNDDHSAVKKKLRLLQLLPRSRAKRLLNQWSHPMSLMLRAREHSLSILSGLEPRTYPSRSYCNIKGSEALYNRYLPLDSFLDLLTAKASLAELDFNLLVEATMSSLEKCY